MKLKENINYLTSGISWIATAMQTNEYLQVGMLVLSIISTCITIAFTIYKWYNKAKADGKITPQEVEQLEEDLKDALNEEDKKE